MILPVLKYGDPVLRRKGAPVEAFDADLQRLVENMFETMYDARGIGLAAQQVGYTIQLAVVDVSGVEDRPSTLQLDRETVNVEEYMPVVLVNPVITALNEPVSGPEGCLSFPEIYGEVTRPESVKVEALNEEGERIEFECGGLLSKVVQHETDHLHGILYIDRMTPATKKEIKPLLEQLRSDTQMQLKRQK